MDVGKIDFTVGGNFLDYTIKLWLCDGMGLNAKGKKSKNKNPETG